MRDKRKFRRAGVGAASGAKPDDQRRAGSGNSVIGASARPTAWPGQIQWHQSLIGRARVPACYVERYIRRASRFAPRSVAGRAPRGLAPVADRIGGPSVLRRAGCAAGFSGAADGGDPCAGAPISGLPGGLHCACGGAARGRAIAARFRGCRTRAGDSGCAGPPGRRRIRCRCSPPRRPGRSFPGRCGRPGGLRRRRRSRPRSARR